jgi:hypothetical protein
MQSKKKSLILGVGLVSYLIALSILCNLYAGNAAETAKNTNGLTANSTSSLDEIVLAKVSEKEKVPIKDLMVAHAVTLKPENIYRAKVLDKKAGKIYEIDLDSNHQIMDEHDIDTLLENKRKSEFVGKLSKGLVKKMEEMKKSGETDINVEIWIKTDEKLPQLPREMLTIQEREAHLKEIRDFYANLKNTNAVGQKLAGLGYQILYRSQYAPVLSVRMTIDAVTKVEADTNIANIYAIEVAKPLLNISALTVHADAAWADPNYNRCPEEWLGYIPIVAIIEAKGAIASAHSAIQGPISYYCAGDPDPTCSNHNDPNNDAHSIAVMGIIAADSNSPYGLYMKGVAYNVCRPLLSAGFVDGYHMEATDWALSHWATVINLSWAANEFGTGLTSYDKYFDFIAESYHRTVVAGAGNDENFDPNHPKMVTSPGRAYNVITVGAFSDRNSVSWQNDLFPNLSRYRDPCSTNNDRRKPEVVAPGVQIWITDKNNGYTAVDGTSFAAPHVTGAAALLIAKSPYLEAQPEEVAAILMASAIHDIVDDPNAYNPFLHDKDGVGAIDIASAKNVIDNGLNSHYIFTANDFPFDKYFSVTQGEKVRAVIRWFSKGYSYDYDVLKADLDLVAYDPDGNVIMSSASSLSEKKYGA